MELQIDRLADARYPAHGRPGAGRIVCIHGELLITLLREVEESLAGLGALCLE